MDNPVIRLRCSACWNITEAPNLLTAPNPFNPEDEIIGCPICKEVTQFDQICDEPGCNELKAGGWLTGDKEDKWGGYRQTCWDHYDPKERE